MWNTQYDLEQTTHSLSAMQILKRPCKFAVCAVLGTALACGLCLVILIVIAIVLYKFQPKYLGIMLILGGTAFLVAAAAWWIARSLWKTLKRLISNSDSPETSAFLINASAALVVVCMS